MERLQKKIVSVISYIMVSVDGHFFTSLSCFLSGEVNKAKKTTACYITKKPGKFADCYKDTGENSHISQKKFLHSTVVFFDSYFPTSACQHLSSLGDLYSCQMTTGRGESPALIA